MEILEGEAFFNRLEDALENSSGDVCSIRIVAEDDDTFDIRIWDERDNESREDIEEGHFKTFEEADKRLEEIVEENNSIKFLRMRDEL